MIIVKTLAEVDVTIRAAAAAGHQYIGPSLDVVINAIQCDVKAKGGAGIYLTSKGGLSWSGHPHYLTHNGLIAVNNIRHAVSHLRAQTKRPT